MKKILLVLPVLALLGCKSGGGGSAAVDENGLCKQSYIDAYNAVIHAARTNSASATVSACGSLNSNYSGVSCTAEINYSAQVISNNDHTYVCSTAERIQSRANESARAEETGRDSDGSCSQSFINAYNAVSTQASAGNLDGTVRACDYLKSTFPSVSCSAQVNYSTKYVSTSDKNPVCDKAKELQDERDNPAPVESAQPERAEQENDEDMVMSLNTKLVVKVVSPVKAQSITNVNLVGDAAAKQNVAINGSITTMDAAYPSMQAGVTGCTIKVRLSGERLSEKQSPVVVLDEVFQGGNRRVMSIMFENGNSISCSKGTNLEPFKLKDVRAALDGIIEFSVKN